MTETEPTCIGYARYRANIDRVEQYTSPSSVEETLIDFKKVSSVSEAKVIAFVNGSKFLSDEKKQKSHVHHMAYIEDSSGNCSHRDGIGTEVESTTLRKLLDEYIDERDIYFTLLLVARNS